MKPKLEDVIMTTTLDNFIASIKIHVVVLVPLEQVVGRHLIAADKKSLKGREKKESTLEIQILYLSNGGLRFP